MIDNFEILYGITSIFYALIAITTTIGAIIYTTKKKDIAGVFMIIGSIVSFLCTIAYPIITALTSALNLDMEQLMLANYSVNVLSCFFSIIFVIGFIIAVSKLKKES
ncbi:MAG: hypothetical protein ABJD66_03910 [Cellulophaga sp.]|uniref:hypothetical protein n=1 Tax=unclassified Cellulophaga TaxID=2634405 RepID=UPI000C2C9FBD|nr:MULTISPECIES: hypothetical protein [unclassified Cellulophaga]MDO6490791.1 hypothetical protein [Cellulophaga sp. 2_MG-2023]MDO6494015.1 hypothetical protein [Cellulophaga sp. 3_MG-2023]PKB43972.1 hypothetical protein AX016_2183 [Cellulophaga sp. RHA19]